MRIKAMVAPKVPGDFSWCDVDIDDPRDDEILVRIKAVGLCHTDIVAQMGFFNFEHDAVLGHEGAGVVERVGSKVTSVKPGDRVAISFRSCGHCSKCDAHMPPYCYEMPLLNYAGMRPDGSHTLHRDGAPLASSFFAQSSFATHAITYERNVVKLPDDVPFEIGAPLGCGVQTGAGAVINAFKCKPGSSIAIAGGGTVGLCAVMGAAIQKCGTIIVIEPYEERRKLALELGATHVIDPIADPDIAAKVREILPMGVEFAIDTSGRPDVLEAMTNMLEPQGTLGLIGVPPPETRMPGLVTNVMTFGHTIRGIIEGDSDPSIFLPQLMDHYRGGRLPLDKLVTCYKLTDINRAVHDQHDGKCIKVVLTAD